MLALAGASERRARQRLFLKIIADDAGRRAVSAIAGAIVCTRTPRTQFQRARIGDRVRRALGRRVHRGIGQAPC